MVSWWAAKRCAGRAVSFALLIVLVALLFQPSTTLGQPRCEMVAARIVSAEGDVSIIGPVRGSVQPVSAGELSEVCSGETVLVGPRSRAAVRLEETGQVIRLDQGTTLRVLPPRQSGRPLLDLSRGIIDLFSPADRPLDVQTPYVTAGVEGTEFFVVVNPSHKVTEVGVIEGRVGLENAQGRLSLTAGEAAAAPAGSAPRRIEITPRDQVRWAIYYPPTMWELPAAGATIDPTVYRAWQAWRAGALAATVREINAISSTEGLNAVSLDYLAAILISLGPGRRGAPVARPERQARSDLAARPGAARHRGGREKPAATGGRGGGCRGYARAGKSRIAYRPVLRTSIGTAARRGSVRRCSLPLPRTTRWCKQGWPRSNSTWAISGRRAVRPSARSRRRRR